jgi:hypothetical protein
MDEALIAEPRIFPVLMPNGLLHLGPVTNQILTQFNENETKDSIYLVVGLNK